MRKNSARVAGTGYDGFIARTFVTMIRGFARGVAATKVFARALHSFSPVASNSRNGRMRDIIYRTAAKTDVELPAMRFFVLG